VNEPAVAVAGGLLPPPAGLALDEALVRCATGEPQLAIWRTRPAVIVGRFQRPDWEVEPDACRAAGARIWRRFSGGGAVYLDEGVVCATLILPSTDPSVAAGIPTMYRPFLGGLAAACRALGVDASVDERTVRVGDRKVTGIAAHRGRLVTMVHGTLLVDADLDALRACLAGPRGGDLQGAPRPTMSRPDHVANIGGPVEQAAAAVAAAFGADLATAAPPSAAVDARASALQRERYLERAWHAGPWAEICDPRVAALLGPTI
jgi:lipoate-protein ligase A